MTADGKTYAGKHPMFIDSHFSDEEKVAINTLATEFYLTNGGEKIRLGANSEYKYIIISPTDLYKDMFNLDREIIVVFSPYKAIQARTLDVFEYVAKRHSSLRIEKICNVLISADEDVEHSINELVKNEPETQIIIPFSYRELSKSKIHIFLEIDLEIIFIQGIFLHLRHHLRRTYTFLAELTLFRS